MKEWRREKNAWNFEKLKKSCYKNGCLTWTCIHWIGVWLVYTELVFDLYTVNWCLAWHIGLAPQWNGHV